jgi:hypothetical protein
MPTRGSSTRRRGPQRKAVSQRATVPQRSATPAPKASPRTDDSWSGKARGYVKQATDRAKDVAGTARDFYNAASGVSAGNAINRLVGGK